MQEIKDDLKAIKHDIGEIKTTLAVNTKSLEHHVERTGIAEKRLDKVEAWTLGLLVSILLCLIGATLRMVG